MFKLSLDVLVATATRSDTRHRFFYCVRYRNRHSIGPLLLVVQRQHRDYRNTVFSIERAVCQKTASQLRADFILPLPGILGFDEAEYCRIGRRWLYSPWLHRDE